MADVDEGGQSKVDPKVAFATERSIPILIRKADWGGIEEQLAEGKTFVASHRSRDG